jgi:hypothetical protein
LKRFIFVVCEVFIIENPCAGIVSKDSIKLKILGKVPQSIWPSLDAGCEN